MRKQPVLVLLVLIRPKKLVEVSDHQSIKLGRGFSKFEFNFLFSLVRSVGVLLLICLQLTDDRIRFFIRARSEGQYFFDLLCNLLFTHVRLRAIFLHAFCASQIVVAFLRFGCDEAAALAAMEDSPIQVGLEPVMNLWLTLSDSHFLALIKQGFTDNWLMLPFVMLTTVAEGAVVNGVAEQAMNLCPLKWLPVIFACCWIGQAEFLSCVSHLIEGVEPCAIQLKQLAYEGRPLGIRDDLACRLVIEIADRGHLRPDSVFNLLALASLDVLAKCVDVIFRHAEKQRKRELALRSWLEIHCRKLQLADDARVKKMDDPTTIKHIARKSVRVPSDDAVCFAPFNAFKQSIKNWSARLLSTLLFQQNINDIQAQFCSEFANLGKLILDAADLSISIIRGFASINEEFWLVHLPIIP